MSLYRKHAHGRALRGPAIGVAAAFVVLSALTACGSGDGGRADVAGAEETGAGGGLTEADAMTRATERLDQASAPVTYEGSTEPLNVAELQGKKVCIIAVDMANQFVADISNHAAEGLKRMGVESSVLNGRNDPNAYTAYIRQCIQQKVAGIMLQNIGSLQTPEGTRAAAEAGIPVITSGQIAATDDPEPNVDSFVAVDTRRIGELQSDLAYKTSGGKVNAIGFGVKTLVQDTTQMAGQEAELKRLCPDCSYKSQAVELGSFQTKLPGLVRSGMVADPELNWFFPCWDILATYVQAGVQQANSDNPPQISSYNGIASAREAVRNGKQAATWGIPLKVWGYAAADTLGRLIVKQDAPPVTLPFRMLTKEILSPLPADASEEEVYGSEAALDKYRELWATS
jgi:ribose transport system substrate-binding protein